MAAQVAVSSFFFQLSALQSLDGEQLLFILASGEYNSRRTCAVTRRDFRLSAYFLPLTNRRPRCQPLLLFAPVWAALFLHDFAAAVVARLQALGHCADVLVSEFEDIPLAECVRRVNAWCRRLGKDNVVLVSVHVDASGSDGQWHTATGWSCYTSPGQTAGDRLADCLYRAAEKHLQGHKIRTDYSDGDPDKEARFALLTRTRCAAALTENGFQDSRESLAFLESPSGKKAVIGLHVEGIIEYIMTE